MWTNVFRIGGLHHVSWFQFLPSEFALSTPPDRSTRAEQKDAGMYLVLSSCLQLQKEGFLSTWTNSFVGPWDPSQGLHNPDEKIKLWLFLPGRHSSVVETAQAAVSRLRVVASGLWLAPGDSEEVAVALSQALRNCIERALSGLSYMRFGDVFSKYFPYQGDKYFRKGQPTIEFIFAATEEAIFVHVIISAKNVRTLSNGDVERALKSSFNNSSYKLPVIVSPHGMRGNLTGFYPNDLVKQVYISSGSNRTSSGYIGLPTHVGRGSGCKMNGQNCYVEVKLGRSRSVTEKAARPNSNSAMNLATSCPESPEVGRGDQKDLSDQLPVCEKTFIYPPEAILVPVLQTPSTRSSLKRFWLQNWMGPPVEGSSFFMHWGGDFDSLDASGVRTNGISMLNGYNSSSNSNNSSICSTSSASSESDYKMTSATGDLEADADSLTCRQSGLSYNDQLEYDHSKMGSKRPRTEMAESFAQVGMANDPVGSLWDWDDDRVGMDIQALLSEFGDFGDFFENDALPFGEPPGTAESQALAFPPDSGDFGASPVGMMDVSDQMLLPAGLPSFESFIPIPSVMEECLNKNQEAAINTVISGPIIQASAFSNGEFDHLMKAEAIMSFAPEYGAVETPISEFSSSFFRRPYIPKSHKVESSDSRTNSYVYSATPPSSHFDGSDEKSSVSLGSKAYVGNNDRRNMLRSRKYYTQVEGKKGQHDKRSAADTIGTKGGILQWQFSNYDSTNSVKAAQSKKTDCVFSAENMFLSSKTLLATDVECIMFQAYMCRMRYILISSSCNPHVSLTRFTGNSLLNQLSNEPSTMTDSISARQEMKKKESIPIRIAGDMDGGILDGHLTAPVGVWRTVGFPKVAKPADSPNIEVSSSMPHSSFSEERLLSYGQRQPLQELLDGIALLVQQATSFIDVSLDSDCGNGPYGWLALQELWRRELSCGPSMVHAGCGGTLASCHSLDISGVELMDPLSSEIHPSCVITLLQSDIKSALKSAFGALDGPLSATDWCKGHSLSGDVAILDGSSAESALSECRESSSTVSIAVAEAVSPSQSSAVASSGLKVSNAMDGGKVEETYQSKIEQEMSSSELLRPTLFVLPSPAILVGYQDDWLKTSPSSLQHWEKAPFEPYAVPKHINYTVVCPDIDPLTSAAADFFQQLGIVYETCRLGNHSPQSLGNQMEIDSGKLSSSGFVLLDCPQSMKIESSNSSLLGSLSDYFLSLSNGWNVTSYLKSLSKALMALKLGSCLSTSQKEGSSSPCMVIYVVCPFPEPMAVLRTIVESSVAVGSVILQSDRDKRSILHSQVGRALNCSAAVDEASMSHIPVLSGFSIPKLVLQIVTVDSVFRITSPTVNELVILKETAFAVYNKARRISRGSCNDAVRSSSLSSRSSSVLTQMSSIQGIWKDCVGSRITGPSLPREGEIDASLRSGTWDNSWQTSRSGGLSCEPNRNGDFSVNDEMHYMFEPLFILCEPGSVEHGVSPNAFGNMISESTKPTSDDSSRGFVQSASPMEGINTGSSSQLHGSQLDDKTLPSLHCCYGWTEDWRWLVSIWTDARGELLDSNIYPFGGISSRQDTKGLQCLFVQVLQQGCQILQACSSSDAGTAKPRDFVITRIGNFFELEYQEWQKAIFSAGGSEVKKWPIQLRRSVPIGVVAGNNGTSLQQQEISLIQERTLPASASSLYSPHTKAFIKGGLGQATGRKQVISAQSIADMPRGLLQWVHSITFASISVDHSLQLVCPAESLSPGGAQSGNAIGPSSYLDTLTPVKSLGSTSVSYMLIPSPSMRFLHPAPLQLPTCLTAESPPLAHLLHSKGSAIPLSTGFVVSKATPSMRKDYNRMNMKEEWPSVLSVSLVDYYGGYDFSNEKIARGTGKQGGRTFSKETKDFEVENHLILESVAAELHALSWMTVSPAYLDRQTALPFHCDMVMKLRRLLHFADKELSRQPDKSHG